MGRRARGKRGKSRKTRLSEDVLLISLSWPTPQKQRDRGRAGGEGLVIIERLLHRRRTSRWELTTHRSGVGGDRGQCRNCE